METKLYGEIAPGGKWAPLLLLLALAVYVPGLWTYPLSDAESKYAEIPREMLENSDWITPRIDYVDYLTKPPLSFWATMLAYKLGGVSVFTGRLPNAIFALALAFVIGSIGRTLFGTRASTIATVMALLSAEFYVYTREAGIEMSLVFFMTLAHHCFLRWQRTEQRKWVLGFWASAAGAVLCKGPMGIIFPLVSIFVYLVLTQQRGQFRRLFTFGGLVVFVLLALPWPIAMEARHPGFLWQEVVMEPWGRLRGTRLPKDALFPTWRFLGLAAAGLFPWIQHLPQAIGRGLREARKKSYEGHCIMYLFSWAFLPLVVFSLSNSKVEFYALQAQPGLILLVAWLWERCIAPRESAPSRGAMASTFLLSAVLAAICWGLYSTDPNAAWIRSLELPPSWMVRWLLPVALVTNLVAGVFLLRGRLLGTLVSVAALMVTFFAFDQVYFAQLTATDSMHFAVEPILSAKKSDTRIVCDERPEFAHVATLPFYIHVPCYILRDAVGSHLVFDSGDPREERVIPEKGQWDSDPRRDAQDAGPSLKHWVHDGLDVFLIGRTEPTEKRLSALGLRWERKGDESGGRAVYRIRAKK